MTSALSICDTVKAKSSRENTRKIVRRGTISWVLVWNSPPKKVSAVVTANGFVEYVWKKKKVIVEADGMWQQQAASGR